MKKSLLLVAILMVFNALFANPVDADYAKSLAEKFVKANFEKGQSLVELEYTVTSDSGEPCLYVFNVGDQGYVMMSANNAVRPVLAYSEESTFDVNNVAPGLQFVMEGFKITLTKAFNENLVATPQVKAEWNSLEKHGALKQITRGSGVGPLCTTKWDQSWPYNKYCPEQSASYASNGHVVVGCAATAMSQIMRYWAHPTQGTGSYYYYDATYGKQEANFGATTYRWDLMPDMLTANSPSDQIDAVATLCYHAGVSIDMQYDNSGIGSGAFSTDVRVAMKNYFGYKDCQISIKGSSTPAWESQLRTSLEMGYPVYYSGVNPDPNGGGHAFVCDGFDANGLFHFNYGWSGAGDGYFATEAIDYTEQVMGYLELVPQSIYDNTAKAPVDFTVTPASGNELSATLSWKNPSTTVKGTSLPAQFDVVVERSGKIIHTEQNTTPDQVVTFIDNTVPYFSNFEYNVYALVNDAHGKIAKVENVSFGPTCEWTIIMQSTVFTGGDAVKIYNAAGDLVKTVSTTNATSTTHNVDMPLGEVSFVVTPSTKATDGDKVTVLIKDSSNETVFSETFNFVDIKSEPFFTTNNTCGNTEPCDAPSNLEARVEGQNVVLTWDGAGNPTYGYNVYCNGKLIALTEETTYTDTEDVNGSRCYVVAAFCDGGNSSMSNETYALTTENCDPAVNVRYEMTNNNRVKLLWDAPQNSSLSGYYIMRKAEGENEWKRLKLVGKNKTDYTDNSSLSNGVYYYQVIAYYQDTDCLSSPAVAADGEYYVEVHYTTSLDENAYGKVNIYPNPTNDKVTVKAEGIKNITVVNMLGQKVYESSLNADQVVVDFTDLEAGLYMIRVTTDEYEIVERVSVVR